MNAIGKRLVQRTIRAYQYVLSPLLGPRCRFYPSCSEYAYQCFTHQTFGRACLRVSWRLLKCNPLHPGGVDLP